MISAAEVRPALEVVIVRIAVALRANISKHNYADRHYAAIEHLDDLSNDNAFKLIPAAELGGRLIGFLRALHIAGLIGDEFYDIDKELGAACEPLRAIWQP